MSPFIRTTGETIRAAAGRSPHGTDRTDYDAVLVKQGVKVAEFRRRPLHDPQRNGPLQRLWIQQDTRTVSDTILFVS